METFMLMYLRNQDTGGGVPHKVPPCFPSLTRHKPPQEQDLALHLPRLSGRVRTLTRMLIWRSRRSSGGSFLRGIGGGVFLRILGVQGGPISPLASYLCIA